MSVEKDPFKFVGFSDTIQLKNGMATKKEIDELLTFLGAFEKWPMLIEDCRREVVKYLDYKTRFNLGICSKNDHETVEKTKICVKSMAIIDNQKLRNRISKAEFDSVSVRIRFPNGKSIKWVFSPLEQDTRVQWLHYIPEQGLVPKEVIWKSCNYYEEAVKFGEKWMRKSNFEMEEITVGMAKYPFATSQIKTLPCCKQVRIRADDLDFFEWWLKKLPEQLESLHLDLHSEDGKSFTLPSNFLNAPQIMQASRFHFWCRAAFPDEQFLKLKGVPYYAFKAKSIWFESVDVTDRGINTFIKNWVHGSGVDDFKKARIWDTSNPDWKVVVAELDYVEWDESFEKEHRKFVEAFKRCCGPGRRYQIKSKVDPFKSLTLSIFDKHISIYATGECAEHNGEAYTYYWVP
ncbi:unnamed protein product [Caenorhabditis brenneri]